MSENAELMSAIIAHPAEDTPRLVYADWLDEHGDPDRARFIRLQFEMEKLPPIGLKASKAKKEEEALLKRHGKEWAGEIAGLVQHCRFRRGFIESIRVTVADFLRHGERLFELAPLREVQFVEFGDRMPALAASPLLGRAEALAFSAYIMDQLHDEGRLELLLASPHLARVRRLDLSMSRLDRTDAQSVARCPNLGALVHLDLSWNQIGDSGLAAIAHSDRLPALTSFTIRAGSEFWIDGIHKLIDSPLADRLEHLCLASQQIGNAVAMIVATAPRLTRLFALDLSDNALTDTGADALAAATHLAGLRRLIVRGHRKTIGKAARERLKKRFGKDVCVF